MNRRLAARLALAAVAALGIALRLWVAIKTHGSNDIDHWHDFGKAIDQHGLRWCYENIAIFNHPPLAGYWAMTAAMAERVLGWRFDVTFKLLPLAADIATGALLYQRWRERGTLAVALFAVSVISILLTGYHGNTDPALAMLVMLSGLLFERQRLFLAGLALGLAINVKLIPVVLIPVLGLQCRNRRDAMLFFGALGICALPFLPMLLAIFGTFVKNAISYNSSANRWGIYGLLGVACETKFVVKVALPLLELYWAKGRYVVLASAFAIGIAGRLWRRWSAPELVAMAISCFLIFTPGFGIQYTVYAAPALFAISLARGAIYSTIAGLFALLVYVEFSTGVVPYHSVFKGHFTIIATEMGLLTWVYLIATVIRTAAPRGRAR